MTIQFKDIVLKATVFLVLFLAGDLAISSVLKRGMDHYYGMDKEAEILCIGHSHTVLGIDAERLEQELGVPVSKYAIAGANTLDRFWMLSQFVGEHPTVKMVIYDVDSRLFDAEGLSSASYTLFLPYIGNDAISNFIKQEALWQEYYASKILRTARFRDQTINIALRGLSGKIENKKDSRLRIENYTNYIEREKKRRIRLNPASLQRFRDSITYLTKKGIKVFLFFVPVVDVLNTIDPESQDRVIDIFKEMAIENSDVCFLNYNQEYQHNYELFYDLRHLNREGNKLVTDRLIKELQQYVK